ncbi:YigZ family protein [Chitinivorax sp. B]|uniref:IMPACT family protein n=1 Tax=Chitinivorax sp. B TaxID=2502235 RepID=UPI0010F8D431|nr:YigZ family protein [Chitinivorax sp. B]
MNRLLSPVAASLEIKKSRFLGWVVPAYSRAEVQQLLDAVRRQHPDAAHHCWAWILGNDAAMNDDGEPAGTAGKPILNVLQHKQLGNTLAVVTRYYGGIKLGAGGLVRAYGQAVSLALADAILQPVVAMAELKLVVPVEQEGRLRAWLTKVGIEMAVQHDFAVRVFILTLPADQVVATRAELIDLTHGRVQWRG